MAILKYKGSDGQFIAVNSYKINNVIVSQETGESTADVMSQKAVTDEINALQSTISDKADKSNVYTKTETETKLGTKANSNNVYTKTETDNKLSAKANSSDIPTKVSQLENDNHYLTTHQSLTSYALKSEVTTADNQIKQTINDNETAVTAALNKLKQSAGFNASGEYTSTDYSSLADAIDDLVSRLTEIEEYDTLDGGEY